MFAIRLRVRPCRARCSPRSVGRATVTAPSSCSTVMSGERVCRSSPFGPLTAMLPGAISTETASGTGTGFLPIRLICSPDVGDDLAADALLPGFVAGHHASGGADDRGSGSAVDPGNALVVDVATATRARDPFDPEDHRLAVLGVLELDLDRLADGRRLAAEVLDVALLLEDPGHLQLEAVEGDLHLVVPGADRVPDAGQVIGDRVGVHGRPTSSTWSCRGCTPRGRRREGRSGRGRICGSRRADGRSAGSGCSCAT